MSDHEPPETFPGAGWYAPEAPTASPTATTLPPPEDEDELERLRELEAARRARPFGFARALEP